MTEKAEAPEFGAAVADAYQAEGPVIDIGRGVHDGKLDTGAVVQIPLRMMNRHGLIAGATGTGKTKTLQVLAEQLSAQGVPVFVADMKGDVSGLAAAAEAGGPAEKRMTELGLAFEPGSFPVEFLALGAIGPGVPVRATLSDFGHQLIAKVLEANETQEQSLFETLPEAGDLDKPKLVFFFDEAHLLFSGATEAFVESVEQTVRLIRSKGVGVFFVTQTPKDIPGGVLEQLGNRVQHALRAFTPDDAKDLKRTVSTFPTSDFYDLEELLPALGIGEAVVTILSESGVPTPVVHTRMRAPASRMGPCSPSTPPGPSRSPRGRRLAARTAAAVEPQGEPTPPPPPPPREEEGGVADFLRSRQGKALQRQVVRGVFGMLRKRL